MASTNKAVMLALDKRPCGDMAAPPPHPPTRKVLALDEITVLQLLMSWAALAPLVWGRCLMVMVPLLERLGPMMGTFRVGGGGGAELGGSRERWNS